MSHTSHSELVAFLESSYLVLTSGNLNNILASFPWAQTRSTSIAIFIGGKFAKLVLNWRARIKNDFEYTNKNHSNKLIKLSKIPS